MSFLISNLHVAAEIFFAQAQDADCQLTMQRFFSVVWVTFIVGMGILRFMFIPGISQSTVTIVILKTLYFLICPFLIYLNIRGITWALENEKSSSGCSIGWTVWLDLVFFSVMDIVYACIAGILMYLLIGIFKERRRIQQIRRQLGQLQGEELNAFLVSLNPTESQHAVIIGLTDSQINQIPRKSYGPGAMGLISHEDTCAICLEVFEQGKTLLEMPRCKHTFDVDCASVWLKKSVQCPICRSNLRRDLLDREASEESQNL